jgi:hypothetical protein
MIAPALVACASQSPAQIATDVANLAGGLASAAQTLRDGGMLPASQQVQIDDAITAVQAAATAVASATTATQQQSATQQAVAATNAVLAALAGVKSLPPNVTTVLTAAQVLLPTIEALAGLPVTVAATATRMTPDEASTILSSAAAMLHS